MRRCDQCKKTLRGAGHQTALRTLCDVCYVEYRGVVSGYVASGNAGTALFTGGLFRRRAEREAKKKR